MSDLRVWLNGRWLHGRPADVLNGWASTRTFPVPLPVRNQPGDLLTFAVSRPARILGVAAVDGPLTEVGLRIESLKAPQYYGHVSARFVAVDRPSPVLARRLNIGGTADAFDRMDEELVWDVVDALPTLGTDEKARQVVTRSRLRAEARSILLEAIGKDRRLSAGWRALWEFDRLNPVEADTVGDLDGLPEHPADARVEELVRFYENTALRVLDNLTRIDTAIREAFRGTPLDRFTITGNTEEGSPLDLAALARAALAINPDVEQWRSHLRNLGAVE